MRVRIDLGQAIILFHRYLEDLGMGEREEGEEWERVQKKRWDWKSRPNSRRFEPGHFRMDAKMVIGVHRSPAKGHVFRCPHYLASIHSCFPEICTVSPLHTGVSSGSHASDALAHQPLVSSATPTFLISQIRREEIPENKFGANARDGLSQHVPQR